MIQCFYIFIVEKLLHKSLVSKIYPLHDQESLKRLGHSWLSKNPANLMKQLPLSILLLFKWKLLLFIHNLFYYWCMYRWSPSILWRRCRILFCFFGDAYMGTLSTFLYWFNSSIFSRTSLWNSNYLLCVLYSLGFWFHGGKNKVKSNNNGARGHNFVSLLLPLFMSSDCGILIFLFGLSPSCGNGGVMAYHFYGVQKASTAGD